MEMRDDVRRSMVRAQWRAHEGEDHVKEQRNKSIPYLPPVLEYRPQRANGRKKEQSAWCTNKISSEIAPMTPQGKKEKEAHNLRADSAQPDSREV